MHRALRASVLLVAALGFCARPAIAQVTLTDNGTTVTLANGLVTFTVEKSGGKVKSLYTSALPGTNILDTGGYGMSQSLGHVVGPGGIDDYWSGVASGNGATYSVVTNTSQMVDIMIRNPKVTGDLVKYPNGLWDLAIHHVLRAGESGFYTYHVWRHNATHPASSFWGDGWGARGNSSLFSSRDGYTAWAYCGLEKNGKAYGTDPAGTVYINGETAKLPMTSFYTQPTGQNYEPGWPIFTQETGLTQDLYPTWTKYDWSTYLGPTTSYRSAYGMACDQVGLWHLVGSNEWENGGPTKLKGAASGSYLYMDGIEGHGVGSNGVIEAADGQVLTKVMGPFFTYVNSGTSRDALWADAQAKGAQHVAAWPYAWVNEPEADYPRSRGTVTGKIETTTGQNTAGAVVILGAPGAANNWIFQGGLNYLFWTTADANGNFSIPKVRPGTYTLFSYVPGVFGELQVNNIAVSGGQITALGTVNWNPPRAQRLLFQVGTPDHSTGEFRFGDLMKQHGLWWRYFAEMGTADLTYVVGQSDPAEDWYYAQPIFAIDGGTYCAPKWNVVFNTPTVPVDPVVLTVDLAGGRATQFYVDVNGVNRTPSPYNYSGIHTESGADIYRSIVKVGRWQHYTVTLPASAFQAGINTLTLRVRQGGGAVSWDTTGPKPEMLLGGLMYDALRLESGPQATQIVQDGVYQIGSKLNGLSIIVKDASTASGAKVIEWPYGIASNQQWRFTHLGNDIYSIIAVHSGQALAVQNASTANYGLLVQQPYTGATSQQWKLQKNTAGGLSLINQNSLKAVDIPGHSNDYQSIVQLGQYTSNNQTSQAWLLTAP